MAKDQKLAKCASLRFKAGLLAGFLSKTGPDNPPTLKMAKDQKLAKCASLRFKAGLLAGFLSKTGPDNPPKKKEQHENSDNFCIRTPFSMILGSLESP
jgi:hypothetical protein